MIRFLLKHGATLPQGKEKDKKLKEMQDVVEKEILKEQSKEEDEESKMADELRFAENAFEEARQQLLHLAASQPKKRIAPPLAALDRKLEEAIYKKELALENFLSLDSQPDDIRK